MNHREISEVLPWYANRTLSTAEQRAVELHLRDCSECRVDLQKLGEIARVSRELTAEAPKPSGALLGRTLARIERYEFERTRRRLRFSDLFDRLRSSLDGLWAPIPAFARVTVAAQFLLLAVLAGLLLSRPEEAQDSRTAEGGSESRPTPGPKALILVGFQDGISEATFRQTVRDLDGKIVAGPSSLGLYTIEVPVASGAAQELEQLLRGLRQKRDVVLYAEPVR